MNSFGRVAWGLTAHEFLTSLRPIAELLLLSLDSLRDVSSAERSVRAANLERIKSIILRRLAEPDLSLADIAREAGLTLNYVHKLFRDADCTMYEFLKSKRLQRARELLETPALRTTTITEISLLCGFTDKSYFSRLFKQAFGASPRDMRATP